MDAKKFHNKFMALEEAAKNEIVELLKNNPKGRFIQPNDHYDEDDFHFTEGVWALTGDEDAIIVTAVGLFDDDKLMVRAQMMDCDYNNNEWFAFDEFTHCYWELYEFVVNHLDDADTEPVIVNDTSEDDLDDDDDNDYENDDDDASKCRVVDGVGIIPEGATEIGEDAFYDCKNLTSIVIPDSVEEIGAFAFKDCTGLTSIVIPDSVEKIGDDAFCGCTGLTSIVIPDSVKEIGVCVFKGCTGLTSVVIPDSVSKIEAGAFEGCTGLTSIVIPDSVENIGNLAFRACTGLTSIVIPDSVEKIGNRAFRGCTGLTSIVIPDSVKKFGCDTAKLYCYAHRPLVLAEGDCIKNAPRGRTNGRGCVAYATLLNCSRSER